MNAAATNTGLLGHLKTVIVYLVVAVALYYLYQYFYSSSGGQGVVLLAGKNKADETGVICEIMPEDTNGMELEV